MKHGLASMILALSFSYGAIADELFPIKPIEEMPIEFCEPGDSKHDRRAARAIEGAGAALNCGDYEASREMLLVALRHVEKLMNNQVTGWCYSRNNCRGAKVSGVKMTKAACQTTGVGESWHAVDPVGPCEDI